MPAGHAALATAMQADETLCRNFFSRLRRLAYGGARLPDDLYHRIQALAVRSCGERIVFHTGWGSTETAPTSTGTYRDTKRVALIGLPFPGLALKLVPLAQSGQYQQRLKGPHVMPGCHRRPDLTAAAFDEEGFCKIGGASSFVDPADPAQGLVFGGRVSEDFKLTTSTFVNVGPLRTAAIAAFSPLLLDALLAGQDRPLVDLLAWPQLAACCAPVGLADKGYINQSAGQQPCAALVERLYAERPEVEMILTRPGLEPPPPSKGRTREAGHDFATRAAPPRAVPAAPAPEPPRSQPRSARARALEKKYGARFEPAGGW